MTDIEERPCENVPGDNRNDSTEIRRDGKQSNKVNIMYPGVDNVSMKV